MVFCLELRQLSLACLRVERSMNPQRNLVFKGASRPAMVMGIPMLPFILVALTCALTVMYSVMLSNLLLTLALILASGIVFFWMRSISKLDPWRLNQRLLRFKLRQKIGASTRWNGVSFAPYSLKKR